MKNIVMSDYFIFRDSEEHSFNHEKCGDTKKHFYVRYSGTGWYYHCFKCGDKGYFRQANRGFDPAGFVHCVSEKKIEKEFKLPFLSTLTDTALQWLYKYNITDFEISQHKFAMVGKRLFMPIFEGQTLIGWQERLLEGEGPKYITRKKDKQLLFFKVQSDLVSNFNPYSNIFIWTERENKTLVVVEDILSAIKVGRQASACALLGSPQKLQSDLLSRFDPYSNIFIWLDQDKLLAGLSLARRFEVCGKKVRMIHTPKDPKEYSDQEIKKVLTWPTP